MNDKTKDSQADVIDLYDVFLILRKYILFIIIATIIGGIGSYYFTKKYIPPKYKVTASVIVDYNTSNSDDIDLGQYTNSLKLASLYSVIAKSDIVLQLVIDDLNSSITYEQLKDSISITAVDDTQVVEFSMLSTDPDYAKLVITKFIEYSNETIHEQVKSSSVMYLNVASVSNNGYPVSPDKRKNTFAGALAGFVISAGLFFVKEQFNNKIKSEKEIVNALDVPMLGYVPEVNEKDFNKEKSKRKGSLDIKEIYNMFDENAPSYYIEAYKMIATNMEFISTTQDCKNIVITSALENEGKTNCAVNLALALASYGKKVCLVDCDLRRPSIQILHKHQVGLTNIFNGEITLEEAIFKYNISDLNMDILFAGKVASKPTELIASEKMKNIVDQLAKIYDYVIYDTPPCITMTDSSLLGRYVDASIVVVKSNSTHRKIAVTAKKNLENAGVKIVGSILNQYTVSSDYSNYYYYSYKSNYGSY